VFSVFSKKVKKAQIQNPTEQRPIPEVQNTHLRDNDVESRVRDLKNLDDSTGAVVEPGSVVSTRQISQAAEELGLKVDVLEWMLRAAKHSRRPVLRTLLSEIEESISRLEKAFESFGPPGPTSYKENNPASSGPRIGKEMVRAGDAENRSAKRS
jgi:hypothetical protein